LQFKRRLVNMESRSDAGGDEIRRGRARARTPYKDGMAYDCASRGLNPEETIQVRFAAELFAWMQHPIVAQQGRRRMARFLEELALPAATLPDPDGGPEAALRRMCENDAGVRLRLGRHCAMRRCIWSCLRGRSAFAMAGRYEHAAWLYLMPGAARKLAAQHLGAIECPAAAAAEFLETLERAAADQAAVTETGAPQAS